MSECFSTLGLSWLGFTLFSMVIVFFIAREVYQAIRERVLTSDLEKLGSAQDQFNDIERKIEDAKKRFDDLNREIESLTDRHKESRELDEKLKKKEIELQSLGEAIKDYAQARAECTLLQQQKGELDKNLVELTAKESETAKKLAEAQESLQAVRKKLEDEEKKRDELAQECIEANARKKGAQFEYDSLQKTIGELNSRKGEVEEAKEQVLREKENLDNELSKCKDELAKAAQVRAELELLQSREDALQREKSAFEEEKKRFSDNKEQEKKTLGSVTRQLEVKTSELQRLENECKEVVKTKVEKELEADSLQKQIDGLENRKLEIEEQKNAALREKERIEALLSPLKEDLAKAAQVRAELELLQSKEDALHRLRDALDEEKRIFSKNQEREKDALDSITRQLETKRSELQRLENECKEVIKTKVEKKLEADSLQKQIDGLKDRQLEAEEQKNAALREKERLDAEIRPLRETLDRAHQVQADLARLQNDKAALQKERDDFEEEKNQFARKQIQEKADLMSVSNQLEKQKTQLEKLTDEYNKVRNRKVEVELATGMLDRQKIRLEESKALLETAAKKAGEELKKLREDIDNRRKLRTPDIAASPARETHALERSDLERSPAMTFNSPGSWPKRIPPEKDLLEEFGEALSNAGLVFHERTLRSFHTALKCQKINPLTVLAGVSGTGKTKLPLKYAQYLGIAPLVISVQPRWDSTQDLLGFPNYVEHKFEATDLSRLLWAYNDSKDPLKILNRMSLVLLDEMNLARTEYYFSEFLSKLELRSHDKKSAEIDLGKGIKLSVPGNILMVGTMNEDESTQTLSDKVLDRANVLRFGRPGRMSAKLGKEEAWKIPDYVVTKTIWDSWREVAELPDNAEKRLRGWIDALNEKALDKVGRPFGYRLQKAMLEYVRQYPQYDDRFYETAFADQIEQKILPKLRGVDSGSQGFETCFNEIGGVIHDTRDGDLERAFNRDLDAARQRGYFVWNGVVRDGDK